LNSSAIDTKLAGVRQRMERAAVRAGRDVGDVTLVAVTKGRAVGDIQRLYDAGVRHFGENRVPEAETKIAALPADCIWHMVGNVQRRKAAAVVALFQRVDSVDRLELAEALNQRASDAGKHLRVLVEVNVSGEDAKHGVSPNELGSLLSAMSSLTHIQIDGLMTMAPLVENPESVRPYFLELHRLFIENNLRVASMGMSGDFEVAIEAGATEIRVGTALFG
jgi:hypothetical protein